MYIPPTEALPFEPPRIEFFKGGPKGGLSTEKWSSLIGIITAICGNILISFALNTQRYAHMRLSRDREKWELKQRRERRRNNRNISGYGTQQEDVAEERERANMESRPGKYTLEDPQDSNETEPLIPSVDSLPSRKSSGSSEDGPGLNEDDDTPEQKSYLRSPIWWLGISMMTVGEAGNFLAYGFAPASIVSPLGVVALISNCMIAPFLLRERFRWRDGLGVVIAVLGCVTIVMSASNSNPKLNPDKIWSLITRWEFETYFGITVFLILVLCWASNKFGDKSILIDLGLMGLFGGYTALSTKGVASLLSSSVWKVVTFPITYLLVAILVFTAVMQIKYVNRALQRFNSTMVIPTQFVLFTISVIVGSAILYRDFERTTTEDAVKFVGGCALTFLGVWFITSGRGDSDNNEDDMEDEEEGVDLVDEEGAQPETREQDPSQFRRFTADNVPTTATIALDVEDDDTTIPKPPELSPAKAAAIHEQSASELPPKSRNGALQPPPMHATTSSPEVPTTDLASSVPRTPLRRGASERTPGDSPTKATPSTPQRRPPPDGQLEPTSHRLLNRHSVAGLLPGPITSPLSSSLSAIVADTLRRGVDHLPTPNMRRPSFRRLRKSTGLNPNAPPRKRHSIASGEMDFGEPSGLDEGSLGRPGGPGGRVRSLSATLHDMFGSSSSPKKGRAKSTESIEGTEPTSSLGEGGNSNESR